LVLAATLIVAALIAVNAVYVAAEFAAVSVRRSRIQQLAADGNPLAQWLLPVIESPAQLDRYIAACQIGITLSSLVLGAYAQGTIAVWLQPLFTSWGGLQRVAAESTSAAVVLLILTVAQVIFAELVPKSLALQYPTQTALYTLIPMVPSLWVYRPFIKWLNGTGIMLLKMLGAPPQSHRHIHSPDEIELLIAESRDGGLLEPDEHRRLQRALLAHPEPAKAALAVIARGLNVRQTEMLAAESSPKVEVAEKEKDIFTRDAEDKLTRTLRSKVEIDRKRRGGVIHVRFSSEEELIRLVDEIMGRRR